MKKRVFLWILVGWALTIVLPTPNQLLGKMTGKS